ncbi:MAG: Glyoxalase family protein, partial [uncultured Gemmatimonadaceae bacterium]
GRRRPGRRGPAGPRLHVRPELLRPRRPPLGGVLDGPGGDPGV